jgi:hypothetical protein
MECRKVGWEEGRKEGRESERKRGRERERERERQKERKREIEKERTKERKKERKKESKKERKKERKKEMSKKAKDASPARVVLHERIYEAHDRKWSYLPHVNERNRTIDKHASVLLCRAHQPMHERHLDFPDLRYC